MIFLSVKYFDYSPKCCKTAVLQCLCPQPPSPIAASPSSPFLPSSSSSYFPLFPFCRSWQANLNLFHCDMTQQFHCSSGASSLGAPAASASSSLSASRQPAPRALARHALSWGFSDCCVQKKSPLCHYKSVICPSSASGACCRFFTHSAAIEVHVRLWCHAALQSWMVLRRENEHVNFCALHLRC